MNPLDAIESKLARHPAVSYRRDGHSLTVDPTTPDGFEVGFAMVNDDYLVWFEGWHELFATQEEALNAFSWGLSPACRLKLTYRGSWPVAWTVQARVDGVWRDDSTTGIVMWPFWRRKRVAYKQNTVLSEQPPAAG